MVPLRRGPLGVCNTIQHNKICSELPFGFLDVRPNPPLERLRSSCDFSRVRTSGPQPVLIFRLWEAPVTRPGAFPRGSSYGANLELGHKNHTLHGSWALVQFDNGTPTGTSWFVQKGTTSFRDRYIILPVAGLEKLLGLDGRFASASRRVQCCLGFRGRPFGSTTLTCT